MIQLIEKTGRDLSNCIDVQFANKYDMIKYFGSTGSKIFEIDIHKSIIYSNRGDRRLNVFLSSLHLYFSTVEDAQITLYYDRNQLQEDIRNRCDSLSTGGPSVVIRELANLNVNEWLLLNMRTSLKPIKYDSEKSLINYIMYKYNQEYYSLVTNASDLDYVNSTITKLAEELNVEKSFIIKSINLIS